MSQTNRTEDCMNLDLYTALVILICWKKIVIDFLYLFKCLTQYAEAKVTNWYPYGNF